MSDRPHSDALAVYHNRSRSLKQLLRRPMLLSRRKRMLQTAHVMDVLISAWHRSDKLCNQGLDQPGNNR